MIKKGGLRFGDIVWTDFDPSVGHEYQNKRPAIVIQSNEYLRRSNLVTVIPLSSKVNKARRDDIVIKVSSKNKHHSDSVAKVYCITSFDYQRFSKKIGRIDSHRAGKLKRYLRRYFGI